MPRLAVLVLALAMLLPGCSVPDNRAGAQAPTPSESTGAAPPPQEWPLGMHDMRGTRAALEQDAITAQNVAQLGLLWSFQTDGGATGTPTVRDGVAYVGTWRGAVYAIDAATGQQKWRHDVGAQIDAPVTVWEDLVLVGDAHGRLQALQAATGEPAWSATPDPTNDTHLYAMPVVRDGVVYQGIASDQESTRLHGDRPLDFRGSVAALDARTGALQWRTVLVAEGRTGAPVWSTPVVAEELGLLIFGTGNAYTAPADEHTDSVVALRIADGAIAWSFQGLANDVFTQANAASPDWDFGSTASLFRDASGKLLVGIGQKSSRYWALDAATGAVAWKTGEPVSGQGIIAGSATANGVVIVEQTNKKRVDALNATTGEKIWSHPAEGMVFSGPAIVPGAVLYADSVGNLGALGLADGAPLWNVSLAGAGGVFGGLSVAEGKLFVPAVEKAFLDAHGYVLAFAPGGRAALPGAQAPSGSSDPNRVSLLNVGFHPDHLTVAPGTKVTWVNEDAIYHTATSGWDKGATFDHGLQPGASASYVFESPGTYTIYCKPHASPSGDGWAGMTMTVTVDAAAPT